MPLVANPGQAATDLIGEALAELARPLPHGFVADDDAARAVAATRAILPACPDAACWHTHAAKVRVFPKPRPASNNQLCQSPGGGSWFGPRSPARSFPTHRRPAPRRN